ncbi:hypothetical protein ARAM_002169 [Aspergillus rambellii]|uniref:DUF1168 domain protein n=1 Tax=Aspergillus rambellii TaxID=308745 RepID=A0A0F8X0Z0_9EURO|nr:hypothetical protein ARAM_002169 [Aspergillus rambellii]
MSEPGPDSIPTSADPRSKRPLKRRAVTPHSEHASQIEHLFRDPSKEIRLPQVSQPRTAASLPAPPEIVANVQGSSAGAGSGEFHVYKASRRREYERLRLIQDEIDREKEDGEWEKKREEARRKDDDKTEKNRKRREKRNAAKRNKHKGPSNNNNNNNIGDKGSDDDGPNPSSAKGASSAGLRIGQTWSTTDGSHEPGVEIQGVIIHDD